jgi:hypothetical protein
MFVQERIGMHVRRKHLHAVTLTRCLLQKKSKHRILPENMPMHASMRIMINIAYHAKLS